MILGLNAFHGDVAAVLLASDGRLLTALEEERYRRVKHFAGYPEHAIRECRQLAEASHGDIAHVAVARNASKHAWRKLWFILRGRPGRSVLTDRLQSVDRFRNLAHRVAASLGPVHGSRRLHWVEHHAAHLASAFWPSAWDHAAVCAIDGFGDFVSTSRAVGQGNSLTRLENVYFPHSLGILYLAVTQYLGFPKYGDEYKVMGLGPYGQPDFVPQMRSLVKLDRDGSFRLDLDYFRHCSDGVELTWEDGEPTIGDVFTPRLERLLGPRRRPDESLTERHEAIAASLQVVFEEAVFHVLNDLYKRTHVKRLCLAGGCAMNSVMNGKIRERTPFADVYIQPAAGDNGTALGAALYVSHQVLSTPRSFVMDHAYWGPEFSDDGIARTLNERSQEVRGCDQKRAKDLGELCRWTASQIAAGKVVGWFQGRMEWGARALGNRSIVADPRRADMREIINTKIKFRERFRPFAPSIAEEALDQYFVGAVADPFMIQVYPVRPDKRAVIPAVTHADGSGRLQTVSRQTNERYWTLIKAFESLTGVPVLLNTSFNENEPIVRTPGEALDCFLRTNMDVLVLGDYIIEKASTAASVAPHLAAATA